MFSNLLDDIPFVCFAHRGASGHEPENTLLAFSRAIELGSPWIELDVYSVEGELLVIHDDTLDRTTSGQGRVTDTSLEVLRSLDAGRGQQIPTLREVIDLVGDRAGINIELKGPGTAAPVASLLAEVAERNPLEQFLISSFELEQLAEIRSLNPSLDIGALFHRDGQGMIDKTRNLAASHMHISRRLVKPQIIDEAHRQGIKVYVYTVDQESDIQRMIDLGIDGVFSNFPDQALAVCRSQF